MVRALQGNVRPHKVGQERKHPVVEAKGSNASVNLDCDIESSDILPGHVIGCCGRWLAMDFVLGHISRSFRTEGAPRGKLTSRTRSSTVDATRSACSPFENL